VHADVATVEIDTESEHCFWSYYNKTWIYLRSNMVTRRNGLYE